MVGRHIPISGEKMAQLLQKLSGKGARAPTQYYRMAHQSICFPSRRTMPEVTVAFNFEVPHLALAASESNGSTVGVTICSVFFYYGVGTFFYIM